MSKKKFYSHQKLHQDWMKDPKYRHEYEKLEPEFQIARAIIEARINQKMTQEALAKKVNTGQAVISRLENMNAKPSLSLLQKVAKALDLRLEIRFLPQ
jgi:ribosome-binding protein aMBF1 (putative translation factor)